MIGEHCEFQDSLDAMIRDRLVCGINSIRIQKRLLQEPDLDYDKAFQIAQAMELAAHDVSIYLGANHNTRRNRLFITFITRRNSHTHRVKWNVTGVVEIITLLNANSLMLIAGCVEEGTPSQGMSKS